MQGTAQRIALPALGRGRRSRPARKRIKRRKLFGMCAESPASGARFVSPLFPVDLCIFYKHHNLVNTQQENEQTNNNNDS